MQPFVCHRQPFKSPDADQLPIFCSAGKGTQSDLVLQNFNGWSHISAGDLLRAEVAKNSEVVSISGRKLAERWLSCVPHQPIHIHSVTDI